MNQPIAAPGAQNREYTWAIVAIGAALVALFIAGGLIGAFGHDVPTQLWSAAGLLGGALVGVLVPAPKTPAEVAAPATVAALSAVHAEAVDAAKSKAGEISRSQVFLQDKKDAAQTAAAEVAATAKSHTAAASAAATVSAKVGGSLIAGAVSAHKAAAERATLAGEKDVKEAAADAAADAEKAVATPVVSMVAPVVREAFKVLVPAVFVLVGLFFGVRISAIRRSAQIQRLRGSYADRIRKDSGALRHRAIPDRKRHDHARLECSRCVDRTVRADSWPGQRRLEVER